MGIGSITLGVLSFLCMLGGMFLSWVPFLGAMLSFLSPVLAVGGIILGGIALSRAREGAGGESETLATGGLITSIIAFVPSMLVAVTCGFCGACWTAAVLTPPHDTGPRAIFPDAGAWGGSWAPAPPAPPPPGSWAPPGSPAPISPTPALPTPAAPAPATSGSSPDPAAPVDPTLPSHPSDPQTTSTPEAAPTEPATPEGGVAPALPPPPLPAGPHARPHRP